MGWRCGSSTALQVQSLEFNPLPFKREMYHESKYILGKVHLKGNRLGLEETVT
jgi:hypothetical protein